MPEVINNRFAVKDEYRRDIPKGPPTE